MEWQFVIGSAVNLAINLIYTVITLMVAVIALKYVDEKLLKKMNIEEEIKEGNIAASIFASTIILFVAVIVASSMK